MDIITDAGENAGGMGYGTGRQPVFSPVDVPIIGIVVPVRHEPIIAYRVK